MPIFTLQVGDVYCLVIHFDELEKCFSAMLITYIRAVRLRNFDAI
jgi:hypothetical protein